LRRCRGLTVDPRRAPGSPPTSTESGCGRQEGSAVDPPVVGCSRFQRRRDDASREINREEFWRTSRCWRAVSSPRFGQLRDLVVRTRELERISGRTRVHVHEVNEVVRGARMLGIGAEDTQRVLLDGLIVFDSLCRG
jgi:hypothetical protein